MVRAELQTLPQRFGFQVLCGRTGSGKTRLLHALAAQGAQVLDLEGLAGHRGSVLGAVPGCPQPSQKRFDTLVWQALRAFDPARPVFVESESRKIGALRVPEALIEQLREHGHCLHVEIDRRRAAAVAAAGIRLLRGRRRGLLPAARRPGRAARPRARSRPGRTLARAGRWAEVFAELMQRHYDPLYERSLRSSYRQLPQATVVTLPDAEPATLQAAARSLVG